MIDIKSVVMRLMVIALSLYLIFSLITVLRDYRTQYKNYQNVLKKKEQYEDNIGELKSICNDKSKEKMIENAARERFGFAYPNEDFYWDT